MTPGSFDLVTAREWVGDDAARVLESKARSDADAGTYNAPKEPYTTHAGGIASSMRMIVYYCQYKKRMERNQRKAEQQAKSSV